MTLFQIIMVSLMGAGFATVLGFTFAFIVEAKRGTQTIKPSRKRVSAAKEEPQEDYNIRQMLAQLDEEVEENVEVIEEQPEIESAEDTTIVNTVEEIVMQEEPVLVEVIKEEPVQEEAVEEQIQQESVKPVQEVVEVVEEIVEEAAEQEEPAEEEVEVEIDEDDEEEEEVEIVTETPKTIIIEKVTTETVGTDFDYNVRLAKIVESKNKMERDLQKTKRAITKYERTQRRRARNQKMLDRRAVELTNLNLMMYSVTDIKNVDADKKAKQEELTTHIAELKASIQDADLFLAKNKERYEHDKKMFAFYTKEEARYDDEIRELEILIKNANSIAGTTTTTTTTTTETVE